MDLRPVADGFAVAPQLELDDFAELARMGFRHVVNNRPDGEAPDQPSSASVEAAAKAAGSVNAELVLHAVMELLQAAGRRQSA